MIEEKTFKLLNEFPNLFQGFYHSPMETCMCWGFECGPGWYDLIYDLSKKITEVCPECVATQVKEKFGGLRFYVINETDEVYDLINIAEDLSYKTCERCGSTDDVKQTSGWVVSLCPICMVKREYERKISDLEWEVTKLKKKYEGKENEV